MDCRDRTRTGTSHRNRRVPHELIPDIPEGLRPVRTGVTARMLSGNNLNWNLDILQTAETLGVQSSFVCQNQAT